MTKYSGLNTLGKSPHSTGKEDRSSLSEVVTEKFAVNTSEMLYSQFYLFINEKYIYDNNNKLYSSGYKGGHCRSPCTHWRKAEITENKDVIKAYVYDKSNDRGNKAYAHGFYASEHVYKQLSYRKHRVSIADYIHVSYALCHLCRIA